MESGHGWRVMGGIGWVLAAPLEVTRMEERWRLVWRSDMVLPRNLSLAVMSSASIWWQRLALGRTSRSV